MWMGSDWSKCQSSNTCGVFCMIEVVMLSSDAVGGKLEIPSGP